MALFVLQAQSIHNELARLEGLYAEASEQSQFPIFEQFANNTYSNTKEALEQEAVRLDALLETGLDSNAGTSNSNPWSTPHIKFVKLMEVLANLNTYEKRYSFPFTNETLRFAIDNNDLEFVYFLLANGMNPYNSFMTACVNGQTDVVRVLLQDPRVDPTIDINYDIRFSSYQTKVVHLHNTPLEIACYNGYIEIVQLLLEDGRVMSNPRVNEVRCAHGGGHNKIVQLLLEHGWPADR